MRQKLFFEPFGGLQITQPNQAFTPRQILEQFARGEVIPSEIGPSDTIDSETYSDDDMVNNVIEFEDAIDAENHLIDNQYDLYKEENSPKEQSPKSDSSDKGEQG